MNERENFIQAIKEDEYAELEMEDGVFLSTDVEYDGTFIPGIIDVNNQYSTEEIEEMMEEHNIEDIFNWQVLTYDNTQDIWYPEGIDCEYEEIDPTVWE